MNFFTNGVDEEEAAADLMSYSDICESIRQTMNEVVKLKSTGNVKGGEKKTEITELQIQGSFNFLSLKQLNRAAQIRCKQVKDRTLEAKQKLDGYNLQLENLQYEISHLHKEITKCLEFRSRHDDITLIPAKDFYQCAPTEISNPTVTKSDEHKQTLARLDYELVQRKELADQLEQLKKLKNNITEDISQKKQHLQTLAPTLQNLLKHSLPLQEALNIPLDQLKKQHELARLLPRALFVLFMQAKAYQEACDPLVDVSIDGDADLAGKVKEMEIYADQSSIHVSGVSLTKDDSDSDQDDNDDHDSGRGRRRSTAKSTPMEHDGVRVSTGILAAHPLAVYVKLKISTAGPTLMLTFSYLTTLKFIMVKSRLDSADGSVSKHSCLLQDDELLSYMTTGDCGTESPNPSSRFLLQKSAVGLNDIFKTLGKAYAWAQKICGLEFLSTVQFKQGEDMKISFKHIQETVKELRRRVTSRINLAKQVEQFSKNTVSPDLQGIDYIPRKVSSCLASWSQLTYSEYKNLGFVRPVIELEILGGDDVASNHHFFLATIKRGSSVNMKAAIVIFNDYPKTIPLMTLALQWRVCKTADDDENIREMETELNVKWNPGELQRDDIISLQLMRLMAMLDVYLETECDNDESTQPAEFNLSKTCPHKTKGPARLKPFLYQAATNTHQHRGLD